LIAFVVCLLLVIACGVLGWLLSAAHQERKRLSAALDVKTREASKLTGHNGSLKTAISLMREQQHRKQQEREAEAANLRKEITGLTEANEKLANDFDALAKKQPGFTTRATRWSGPGGARERAEAAGRTKPSANKETA
jgi:cell division protein FtsB